MTVAGFYRQRRKVPFSEIRELVLPFAPKLIEYGSDKACKHRHLRDLEKRVKDYGHRVSNALTGERLDIVLPIASGGFEPAVLIADYLQIDQVFPVRYSITGRRDKKVLIPAHLSPDYPRQNIEGRKILVVDDVVGRGTTISKLAEWVENLNPSKVYFSVVQGAHLKSPDSEFDSYQHSRHLYVHRKSA